MNKKKNTSFVVLIVVLSILVIGLASYIIYDKVVNSGKVLGNCLTVNDENNNNDSDNTKDNVVETKCRGELPFSKPRVKSVVQDAIILDINDHPNFIISSVTMNWCDEILSKLDVAFMVCTPLEIRLKRIQDRERKRFGTRVLHGGDMYEQQLKFRNMVLARQERVVEESAKRLKCPVVVLDGTVSVADNLNRIMGIIHVRDI